MAKNDCGLIDDQAIQKPYALHPQSDCAPTQNKHKSHGVMQQANCSGADIVYENCINYNINGDRTHNRKQMQPLMALPQLAKKQGCSAGVNKISDMEQKLKLIGKPPSGDKYTKHFVGLSLDEREMPITRERSKLYQPNTVKRCSDDSSRARKMKLNGSQRLQQSPKFSDSDRPRSR